MFTSLDWCPTRSISLRDREPSRVKAVLLLVLQTWVLARKRYPVSKSEMKWSPLAFAIGSGRFSRQFSKMGSWQNDDFVIRYVSNRFFSCYVTLPTPKLTIQIVLHQTCCIEPLIRYAAMCSDGFLRHRKQLLWSGRVRILNERVTM